MAIKDLGPEMDWDNPRPEDGWHTVQFQSGITKIDYTDKRTGDAATFLAVPTKIIDGPNNGMLFNMNRSPNWGDNPKQYTRQMAGIIIAAGLENEIDALRPEPQTLYEENVVTELGMRLPGRIVKIRTRRWDSGESKGTNVVEVGPVTDGNQPQATNLDQPTIQQNPPPSIPPPPQ